MARPIYETNEDREREEALKAQLEILWNATFTKLPIKCYADYIAYRNSRAVALVELKCRSCGMNQYPTYMISWSKVIMCSVYAAMTNVPFLLVVQWVDGTGFVKICRDHVSFVMQQDKDFRGDAGDKEPCVHIPISEFTLLRLP